MTGQRSFFRLLVGGVGAMVTFPFVFASALAVVADAIGWPVLAAWAVPYLGSLYVASTAVFPGRPLRAGLLTAVAALLPFAGAVAVVLALSTLVSLRRGRLVDASLAATTLVATAAAADAAVRLALDDDLPGDGAQDSARAAVKAKGTGEASR